MTVLQGSEVVQFYNIYSFQGFYQELIILNQEHLLIINTSQQSLIGQILKKEWDSQKTMAGTLGNCLGENMEYFFLIIIIEMRRKLSHIKTKRKFELLDKDLVLS